MAKNGCEQRTQVGPDSAAVRMKNAERDKKHMKRIILQQICALLLRIKPSQRIRSAMGLYRAFGSVLYIFHH